MIWLNLLCPWEFASFCFRHVFLQAFVSQWVSFAVQLISQQINNQIKVLMWKHISQSSISMFSLARHFACYKERKKKEHILERNGEIEMQLTEEWHMWTIHNPLNLSYWIKSTNPADSKWHRDWSDAWVFDSNLTFLFTVSLYLAT